MDLDGEKTKPIQSQTKPICRASAGNPKHEARNKKQGYLIEGDLKKQSQFVKGINGRKYFRYQRLWRFLWILSAKKQSQFKANLQPSAGRSQAPSSSESVGQCLTICCNC